MTPVVPTKSLDGAVAEIYTGRAAAYMRVAEPHFAEFARRAVDLLELKPGDDVLDVGCGTGLATFEAAKRVGPAGFVTGIDLSVGQIEVARRKSAIFAPGRISYVLRDATNLQYRAEFDAAVSSHGLPLQHAECLRSMAVALKPGGRISICEWAEGGQPFASAFRRMLEGRRTTAPNAQLQRLREVREQLSSQFSDLGKPTVVRQLLETAGFHDIVVTVENVPDDYANWREAFELMRVWGITHAEIEAMPKEDSQALEQEFAAYFGSSSRTESARVILAKARTPSD